MPSTSLRNVVLGLAVAVLCLELLVAVRHPSSRAAGWAATGLGVAMLIGLSAAAANRARDHGVDAFATLVGLALGLMWVVEIGVNNLYPAGRVALAARDIFDNAVWALIAFITIAAAGTASYRAASVSVGIRVGFWSGALSGLIACIAGLVVIAFFIGQLEHSPDLIAEFPNSGYRDLATYVTYETLGSSPLVGAAGHIWLLGLGAGALLGTLGGAAGTLVSRAGGPLNRLRNMWTTDAHRTR